MCRKMEKESWLPGFILTFSSVPGVAFQLFRFANLISLVYNVRGSPHVESIHAVPNHKRLLEKLQAEALIYIF